MLLKRIKHLQIIYFINFATIIDKIFMKLNELIGKALNELEEAKRHDTKKNYLVEEVILEIAVSTIENNRGGFDFKIFNIGATAEKSNAEDNAHKITIKLKPKKKNSEIITKTIK